MAKDYYKILGVDRNARAEEIKKAFRKKAHLHHPDKGNGNAEKFKEANEAYQVLGNAEKKKQYDRFGSNFDGAQGFGNAQGFNWSDFGNQGGFNSGGFRTSFDMGDLGDIFGDLFGGQARGRTRTASGSDIRAAITITLEEAVFGAQKAFDLGKDVVCGKCQGSGAEPGAKIEQCKVCNGSGQVNRTQNTFFGSFRTAAVCEACGGEGRKPEKDCGSCRGRGIVKGSERLKVKIPAGIADGETIKVSGKGEAGPKDSGNGDLYITIKVLPHQSFRRQGDDLQTTKRIKFTTASLGGKVEVETLDGKVSLKIPAGTPSGRRFIVKNQGSNRLSGRGRGDLIVEVKVEVPADLSKKQKKLLEELSQEGL